MERRQARNAIAVKIKNRNILINLSLFIFSVLFALLLSEIALRLLGFEPLYVSPERDRFWKYDPLLGWAHEPGQEGVFETRQFRTEVRINDKGLRDRTHSYERQNDTRRIVVLGDSFAWGYGVEESERFSQLLEKDLDVEVINAGVSGYSTDQELLWYKNEGIKYETDLVILVLTGNDVGDNEQQIVSTIYYKPMFVLEKDQLVLTGYPVPKANPQGKLIYYLSQRSSLAFFLIQQYFDLLSIYARSKADPAQVSSKVSDATVETEPFKITIALIDEIRKTAESHNSKFMIVTTDRWWNYPSEDTYQDFVTVLQDKGFLVLDVESMPGFDREGMIIPDDSHWNRSGHKFAAKEINAFIERYQLLDQP